MRPRVEGFSSRQNALHEWHRAASLRRFIDEDTADMMTACDIDLIEYSSLTGRVLLLHEVAEYTGSLEKRGKDLRPIIDIATRAGCLAFLTLFECSDEPNPANPDVPDVVMFYTKLLYSPVGGVSEWRTRTPEEFAQWLVRVRKWARKHTGGES